MKEKWTANMSRQRMELVLMTDYLLLLSKLIILKKTRAEEIRRHVDVFIPSKSK